MLTPLKTGFDRAWFKDDPEAMALVDQIPDGSPVTEVALLRLLMANPTKRDVIDGMIQLAKGGGPRKGGVAAFQAERAREINGTGVIDIDHVMRVLDEMIIGQEQVKKGIKDILKAWPEDPAAALPKVLGMAGPPGVGKTELFRALSVAFYGTPDAVVIVNCNEIGEASDITKVFGAPPKFAGYSDQVPDVWKPLFDAQANGRPKLVLFDELHRIGHAEKNEADRQHAIDSFTIQLGQLLEKGNGRLANGIVLPLNDAIIGFASNAGVGEERGRKGNDLRKHYKDAFKAGLPFHIRGRVPLTLAFDPHTPETLAQVAKKITDSVIKREMEKRRVRGQVSFEPDALKFLGQVGFHPMNGARPMANMINVMVEEKIKSAIRSMENGERIVFRVRERVYDPESERFEVKGPLSEAKRLKVVEAFRNNDGEVPEEYSSENFPIAYRCLNPKPGFFPYLGNQLLPQDPELPLLNSGFGTLNGRGFMASRPTIDSPTQLHFLWPGRAEEEDQIQSVDLPPRLALARDELKVCTLGERHLLAYAVDKTKDGKKAASFCAVYDAKTQKWEDVAPPELPLVGAVLVGGEGQALLFGGRVQDRRPDGSWTVTSDPVQMRKEPIEAQAYLFNLEKKKWEWIPAEVDGQPIESGVVGAGGVTKDNVGHIVGGTETYRAQGSMVDSVRSARNLITFDFKDQKFGRGTPLPDFWEQGLTFPAVFLDSSGNVAVKGGSIWLDRGARLEATDRMYRLIDGEWTVEQMRRPGTALAVLQRDEESFLSGPFPDAEGYSFDILRPRGPQVDV